MFTHVRATFTAAAALALAAGLAACSDAAAGPAASGSAHAMPPKSAHAPGSRPVRASGAGQTATVPRLARQVQCTTVAVRMVHTPADGPAQRIPAGFSPVAVVECLRIAGPQGRVEEKRQVAVTGLDALVSALRQPSVRSRGLIPSCLVSPATVPSLVLVGRGGLVLRPKIPVGVCGLPIAPVLVSLKSLSWVTLSVSAVPPAGMPTLPRQLTSRPPLQGGPVHRLTPGN